MNTPFVYLITSTSRAACRTAGTLLARGSKMGRWLFAAVFCLGAAQAAFDDVRKNELLQKHGYDAPQADGAQVLQLDSAELKVLADAGDLTQFRALVNSKAQAEAKEGEDAKAAGEKGIEEVVSKILGGGVGWGLAVLQVSGARPVESVTVDSANKVHVSTKSKMRAGAILEVHWLWDELLFSKKEANEAEAFETVLKARRLAKSARETVKPVRGRHVTAGPMAMVELGENAIRSLGAGLMVAMQSYQAEPGGTITPGRAFNLGLVAFAEPNVKRVKGGFMDGQVVPAGTVVSLEDENRFGFGVVFSTNF